MNCQQLEFVMASFNFNPEKVLAPIKTSNPRESCHTLQGALVYINERLEEMREAGKNTWILDDGTNVLVQVNLHSMPLYWAQFPYKDGDEMVSIKNPDMSERDSRPAIVGGTMYQVENKAEGMALLEALASGDNADLNKILELAAAALKEVDEVELPHTRERAEILYNEAGLDKTMGKFGKEDEHNEKTGRMRISKEKTNKMNQYKQTAKRQLGYARLRMPAKKG